MIPSLYLLFKRPSNKQFILGLSSVSLSYFLFSFHVHEKSILFPLLSICLLAGEHPAMVYHTILISSFRYLKSLILIFKIISINIYFLSMYPLLYREGLTIPFMSLSILYHYISSPSWSNYDGLLQKLLAMVRHKSCIHFKL